MRLPALLLALVAALAGCLSQEAAPEAPRAEVETGDASTRPVVEVFEGSATATPAQPFEQVFDFQVPRGAVGVNGTLTYERAAVSAPFGLGATFELALRDPDGEIVAEGYEDVDGRLIVATVEPPKPGAWSFVVRSSAAVNTPFSLEAVAELIVPEHNVVARTVELNPRAFYEVNLILEQDASFRFSFNASGPVAWDIHSHPPEGLKEWETGNGATGSAEFTAPARDVYSVLWQNEGALAVELSFEITGKFRLHSHSG